MGKVYIGHIKPFSMFKQLCGSYLPVESHTSPPQNGGDCNEVYGKEKRQTNRLLPSVFIGCYNILCSCLLCIPGGIILQILVIYSEPSLLFVIVEHHAGVFDTVKVDKLILNCDFCSHAVYLGIICFLLQFSPQVSVS